MNKTLNGLVLGTSLLLAGTAHADWTKQHGLWESGYSSSNSVGVTMCRAGLTDDTRGFIIKGDAAKHMWVDIYKAGWKFDPDQTVHLNLGIDGVSTDVVGHTVGDSELSMIEFPLEPMGTAGKNVIKEFFMRVTGGKRLVIRFADGNEPAWDGSLTGSYDAVYDFLGCFTTINGSTPTLQETSPVSPQETQPVGRSQSTSPIGPRREEHPNWQEG
jgi:hypothetical protein